MNLNEVEAHAKALMTAHGVGSLAFEFDNGKRRLGACHYARIGTTVLPKKITLSRHYAVILPAEEIRDVILHEIAHALTGYGHGHNAVWKSWARKVGAKDQRCASPSASPEATVKGVCTNPDCQQVVSSMHRLPQRVSFHRGCGPKYPLRWFKNGAMLNVGDMPSKYQSEYRAHYNRSDHA